MALGEFCLIQERERDGLALNQRLERGVLRIFQGDGELNSG
jgi:hypothetical protein